MLKNIQENMEKLMEAIQVGDFQALLLTIMNFNKMIVTMLISLQGDSDPSVAGMSSDSDNPPHV